MIARREILWILLLFVAAACVTLWVSRSQVFRGQENDVNHPELIIQSDHPQDEAAPNETDEE